MFPRLVSEGCSLVFVDGGNFRNHEKSWKLLGSVVEILRENNRGSRLIITS